MFYIIAEIVLLALLAGLTGLLYRVTYPACTNVHCTEHRN